MRWRIAIPTLMTLLLGCTRDPNVWTASPSPAEDVVIPDERSTSLRLGCRVTTRSYLEVGGTTSGQSSTAPFDEDIQLVQGPHGPRVVGKSVWADASGHGSHALTEGARVGWTGAHYVVAQGRSLQLYSETFAKEGDVPVVLQADVAAIVTTRAGVMVLTGGGPEGTQETHPAVVIVLNREGQPISEAQSIGAKLRVSMSAEAGTIVGAETFVADAFEAPKALRAITHGHYVVVSVTDMTSQAYAVLDPFGNVLDVGRGPEDVACVSLGCGRIVAGVNLSRENTIQFVPLGGTRGVNLASGMTPIAPPSTSEDKLLLSFPMMDRGPTRFVVIDLGRAGVLPLYTQSSVSAIAWAQESVLGYFAATSTRTGFVAVTRDRFPIERDEEENRAVTRWYDIDCDP